MKKTYLLNAFTIFLASYIAIATIFLIATIATSLLPAKNIDNASSIPTLDTATLSWDKSELSKRSAPLPPLDESQVQYGKSEPFK